MPELGILAWAALALGAAVVGMSKAALPGVNTIAIALFAAALPAKQSTGALLVLLIVGDVFALLIHRRHARLRALLPLIPAVIVGILLGTAFLAFADNTWTKRVIGVILLLVIAVTLWRRRTERRGDTRPPGGRMMGVSYGTLGGFTTMVANAGGPVMSMYFLAMRFPMREFLGTAAYFFAAVNIAKLPFSIGLGILTVPTLLVDAVLVPAVVLGAWLGKMLLTRMNQRFFDVAVIVVTILGAVYLLI
ncbi:sulfite exporter TauE/SafE family protein [Microbacterium sp. JB110]|uniref:sulfite exporter TauE/SafE family protein n=1 Tax=Microbacterium sp. JB110 TaxID=2024477 RepID=UPI00097EB5E3|nr:sulfite exporter TauE/SafE family protein [Microbacterium sp. JB110]RCS61790.1 sulfite exporter TauE/SafE family protein [Microbacterium sp. JB110]SJM65901.1 putative integral membrane protein [Frigoribacterium sp. JB110]